MLGDLQKKKLVILFNTFDANHSGFLEWQDFQENLKEHGSRSGWAADSDNSMRLREAERKEWEALLVYADENMDSKISPEEWFIHFEDLLDSTEKFSDFPVWLMTVLETIFFKADLDGDGKIIFEEYRTLRLSLGATDEEEIKACFATLDTRKSGHITWQDFQERLTEFLLSNDESTPGNVFFGQIPG